MEKSVCPLVLLLWGNTAVLSNSARTVLNISWHRSSRDAYANLLLEKKIEYMRQQTESLSILSTVHIGILPGDKIFRTL